MSNSTGTANETVLAFKVIQQAWRSISSLNKRKEGSDDFAARCRLDSIAIFKKKSNCLLLEVIRDIVNTPHKCIVKSINVESQT